MADVETHCDSVDADVMLLLGKNQNQPDSAEAKRASKNKRKAEGEAGDAPAAAPKRKGRTAAPKCKGCKQKIPIAECAPNFPGCYPCKRALDNIYRLAHKQGEKAVEWMKTQREDEDACYNMVQSYLDQCPEACDGPKNKKRGSWSVLKYRERTEAASGIVRDKVGEMMGRKLYLEFA